MQLGEGGGDLVVAGYSMGCSWDRLRAYENLWVSHHRSYDVQIGFMTVLMEYKWDFMGCECINEHN